MSIVESEDSQPQASSTNSKAQVLPSIPTPLAQIDLVEDVAAASADADPREQVVLFVRDGAFGLELVDSRGFELSAEELVRYGVSATAGTVRRVPADPIGAVLAWIVGIGAGAPRTGVRRVGSWRAPHSVSA